MSNKFEINRDRLFKNGYRRYLQSLSHGALVDFILAGGDLAFTPSQERDLLLGELDDERKRHARATQKINELVHANRLLSEQAPTNTAGAFDTAYDQPQTDSPEDKLDIFIVNVETGETIYNSNDGGAPDELAQAIIDSVFGGVPGLAPTAEITTPEEYHVVYPESVSTSTLTSSQLVLTDRLIKACIELEERFLPFVTSTPFVDPLVSALIQFKSRAVAEAFKEEADRLGVSPVAYASYAIANA